MYAIFEDGSRQYRVEKDSVVTVDHREIEAGKTLEFTRVLLVSTGSDTQIGQPLVAGAKVVAEVIDHPTKKSIIQQFRRRKELPPAQGTHAAVRSKRQGHGHREGLEAPFAFLLESTLLSMPHRTESGQGEACDAASMASSDSNRCARRAAVAAIAQPPTTPTTPPPAVVVVHRSVRSLRAHRIVSATPIARRL